MIRDGSGFLVFAAGDNSYRIELDENKDIKENPSLPINTPVLLKGAKGDDSYSYDNGGAWLYSVHRVSSNTQKLVGFYHAEDHWPGIQTDFIYAKTAWKSVALAVSEDNGKTWVKKGQILTSPNPKPSVPKWGGDGDHCVVWDAENSRWLCFYGSEATNGVALAQSTDPEGKPGSWYKFYNGSFSEPGLGGLESPAPGLGGVPGANPSVHFNTKLQRWVMVFHTHDIPIIDHPNSLYIASSSDLIHWDNPELLLDPLHPPVGYPTGYQRLWNPTVIGDSDVSAGENAVLYYGAWRDKSKPERELVVQNISFKSMSPKVVPTLDGDLFVVPGVIGSSTSFQLTGSETPTSFKATGLPAGLTMSNSGKIAGIPLNAGLSVGTFVASNEVGDSKPANLIFVIDADVLATSSQGAVVTYELPTPEAVGFKSISGSPKSGSLFSIGINDVVVTASDQNGYSQSLTFKVKVRPVPIDVASAPKITAQPISASVNRGAVFVFNVTATGTGPLTYQWRKNGLEIQGATLPKFTINNVSDTDTGSYDVVVRSAAGVTTQSNAAVLSLNTPATIRTQPSPITLAAGQSGTLSVVASGDAPIVYQWRKDGKIIPGATAASYTILNASELNMGSYDVLVSNIAGNAASSAVQVTVNVPTQIVRPPADVSLTDGSVVTLSVIARGSGTLFYQWFRNNIPLPNTNSAHLPLGALNADSKGTYRVEVKGNDGNTVSASAKVDVLASNPASALAILAQPTDIVMLKGSAVSLPVAVNPLTAENCRTRYQLHTLSAGTLTPLALAGSIAPNGQLNLPLSFLTAASADYVIVFSRDFGNGTVIEARSQPFRVETRTWEDAAGSYEALLADQNPNSFDGAHYRGFLSMTVSKTGSVSGRLMYNQAVPFPDGGPFVSRIYMPILRSFSGSLVPDPLSPLKFNLTPKLGSGAQMASQEMTVSLDFGTNPPALSTSIRDHASSNGGVDCLSGVERATRLSGSLPALLSGLPGRYTVVADSLPDGTNDSGQLLIQVLASGRVVWTSRFPGYGGSGSANLNANDPANPTFELYESRVQSTALLMSTNSLLAQIGFRTVADNSRQAQVISDKIECHTSYLAKLPVTNGSPVTYSFNPQIHWSGVLPVSFSKKYGVRWSKAGTTSLPAFFPTNKAMRLTINDLQQDGTLGSYAWDLTVSTIGAVKAVGVVGAQGFPPTLSLRLDKASGELQGFYTVKSVRRSVFGAVLRADESASILGLGWLETPGSTRGAARKWSLEQTP